MYTPERHESFDDVIQTLQKSKLSYGQCGRDEDYGGHLEHLAAHLTLRCPAKLCYFCIWSRRELGKVHKSIATTLRDDMIFVKQAAQTEDNQIEERPVKRSCLQDYAVRSIFLSLNDITVNNAFTYGFRTGKTIKLVTMRDLVQMRGMERDAPLISFHSPGEFSKKFIEFCGSRVLACARTIIVKVCDCDYEHSKKMMLKWFRGEDGMRKWIKDRDTGGPLHYYGFGHLLFMCAQTQPLNVYDLQGPKDFMEMIEIEKSFDRSQNIDKLYMDLLNEYRENKKQDD